MACGMSDYNWEMGENGVYWEETIVSLRTEDIIMVSPNTVITEKLWKRVVDILQEEFKENVGFLDYVSNAVKKAEKELGNN